MKFVPLDAAMSLLDRSERTLWRLVANGHLCKEVRNGNAMLLLDSLRPYLCLPFSDEDYQVLAAATEGDAGAQTEVALIFLEHGKAKNAVYWLELAVEQGFPDAMSLLGRCYIQGDGVEEDRQAGIAWITKAAVLGHPISRAQLQDINRFL